MLLPTPVVGERLEAVLRIPLGDGPLKQGFILQSQLHPRLSQAAGGLGGLNVLYYPTLIQAVNVSQFHTCSQSLIKGEGEIIPLLIWP